MRPLIPYLLVALLLPPGLSSLRAQGSLTPSGAPAATMKTLEQVEARTPIPGGAVAFVINASGSYYLTGDLTPGAAGITVNASHVTIDLNGFSLVGPGNGTGSGVLVSLGVSNVTVRNGTLRGWSVGLSGSGRSHIRAERLRVFGSSSAGIAVGDQGAIIECLAQGNAGVGLRAATGCLLRDSQAFGTTGSPGHGIECSSDAVISGCTATGNAGDGIVASSRSRVLHCVANLNTGSGVTVAAGCHVTDCVAGGNGGDGITAPSNNSGLYIARNLCTQNTGDGIECGAGSHVEGNHCRGNGSGAGDGAGIHITNIDTRVEGNTVIANDRGIDIDFSGCLIIRNHATANATGNYVIAANNRFGPIIDITAASGSAAVNGNSAPDSTTSTHPWANFSY